VLPDPLAAVPLLPGEGGAVPLTPKHRAGDVESTPTG